MKKESFGNSRKCLGQKNLDTSSFEIPEISLAQLILEQFTVNKEMIPTEQNKHLPCVTNKVYEITLFLMFNREFMNDVYRTFRIISRGL